jgi:hypothetical protein
MSASRRLQLTVLLCSLLAVTSCDSPTLPTRNWIELKSIQPHEGSTFAAGEQVIFTAVVEATIATSSGGVVSLIVQAPGVVNEPMPTSLNKGTTTITLTSTAKMPQGETAVTVFIPLWVNENNSTAMMKRVAYSVR